MIKYRCLLLALLMVVVYSCESNTSNYEPIDLMAHGMPIKIMAPANTSINSDDLGIIKDLTIVDTLNGGYNIQIYSCLLYTSPSPRDRTRSRMPSSA